MSGRIVSVSGKLLQIMHLSISVKLCSGTFFNAGHDILSGEAADAAAEKITLKRSIQQRCIQPTTLQKNGWSTTSEKA